MVMINLKLVVNEKDLIDQRILVLPPKSREQDYL